MLTAADGGVVPREVSPPSLEKLLRSVRPVEVQPTTPIESLPIAPARPVGGGQGFTVTSLSFSGNSVFSQNTLTGVAALPTGKEVTLAEVSAAADRITDHYRDYGYILARAIVPPQDVTSGDLLIRVEEGFIDAVDHRGETAGMERYLAETSRRLAHNSPFPLTALENELALLNRLAGVTVRAVLEPAPKVTGAARLTLVVTRDPVGFNYLADSLGGKENGTARQFGIVEAYGLFGVGGRTALTLGSSLPNPRLLQSIGLAHDHPLTRDTVMRLSISQTRSRPGGRLAELEIVSRGRTIEGGVEKIFPRGRGAWLTLGASLNHSASEIRLLDEPISRDYVTHAQVTVRGERTSRSGSVERIALSAEQELGGRQADDISRFGASVTGLSLSARYDGLWRLAQRTSLTESRSLKENSSCRSLQIRLTARQGSTPRVG